MKVLIATNHLADISGSEVVAFEFAHGLRARGCTVGVFANHAGRPMADLFRAELGIAIETRPERIDPLAFDLVYIQHQVAGLFAYGASPERRERTAIVFGRLSRRSFLESGGWAFDDVLGDLTLANSALTAERLAETGVRHPVEVFHNAAPAEFEAAPRELPARPGRILVVSNHRDADLLGAIRRLRAVAEVDHVGRSGDEVRRIGAADIQGTDLVVSIGKTVQYALVARTPVYVYDHFGGPGYLDAGNRDLAARYSFSGRCCGRRLDPEALAAEIVDRYGAGVRFARETGEDFLGRYRLEPYLDRLLALPGTANDERLARIAANLGRLELERAMAAHVRTSFRRLLAARAVAGSR